MSTAPEHHGERIMQPERTPEALTAAMSRIAPHRLTDMTEQKEKAFALAAETESIAPVQAWMTIWAAEVEIERRPDLSERRPRAEHGVQTFPKGSPEFLASVAETVAVLNEARTMAA